VASITFIPNITKVGENSLVHGENSLSFLQGVSPFHYSKEEGWIKRKKYKKRPFECTRKEGRIKRKSYFKRKFSFILSG
jgi:hypothetical protein